jgi:DnaJ-class molecular chaperone
MTEYVKCYRCNGSGVDRDGYDCEACGGYGEIPTEEEAYERGLDGEDF